MSETPTHQTYDGLDQAYAWFNEQLFGGRLPDCLITVRPHRGAYGFFHAEVFGATDGSDIRDEIALNMKHFRERSPAQTLSTLVHEMVHLEQHHFGQPSRSGYHNRQWADMMEAVGLHPSDTGAPGGRRTGQRVSHFIVEDGPFDRAFKARDFVIPWYDRCRETETSRKKRKLTYVCSNPQCEDRATGKPGLEMCCAKCDMVPMVARAVAKAA